MRKPLASLFLLLPATLLAQQGESVVESAPTPVAIEAPVPIDPPLEAAPAADGGVISGPAPIEPPVSLDGASPSVPGVIGQPQSGPAPAIPGTIAPPAPGAPVGGTIRTVNEFQGDDVGAVLRLLARQAGINVVISDQVQGTITMRLEGLSPLEAIKVVVTSKGLLIDQVDNVYYVKTIAEKQREPTVPGHYTFSYAMADKVLGLLHSQLQSGIPPQFDVRTNTVYFREFQSNMPNVDLFLESIDRPTQQVMIEARLVEINANPKQNYGINWAGVVGGSTPQTFRYGGAGDIEIPNLPGGTETTLGDMLFHGTGQNALRSIYGQYAILSIPQMSATLRLLNEDQDSEFLANPRIVTANNLDAKIEITRNQPVPQLNFNEQTATAVFGGFEDKQFGNTLLVRPTINKDDFVTMLVKPEISNKVGDAVFLFAGAEVSSPVIDKRTLESTVLIRSGDTLAIGGLLQDESGKSRAKVPVLGDIPIIGYAFQERRNERSKRNLLVFVTPTIIKQGYGTGLEDQVSGLKSSGEEYADPNGWRNNAKGAMRFVPTSNRQNVADYPKPGVAPEPAKRKSSSQRRARP